MRYSAGITQATLLKQAIESAPCLILSQDQCNAVPPRRYFDGNIKNSKSVPAIYTFLIKTKPTPRRRVNLSGYQGSHRYQRNGAGSF